MLGLFQFPNIRHARRQLLLSQEHAGTSPVSHVLLTAKLVWCSRTALTVPRMHNPALSWVKQPHPCSGALVHVGGHIPSHTRPGGTWYGQVRDAHLCTAMAEKVHHVHAGQVSISLPRLPQLGFERSSESAPHWDVLSGTQMTEVISTG